MAIIDDFLINNETRTVRHVSGTTVYTVNQLYSFIQDTFDEILNMSFTVPMSAQTPTEYTLINSWFIPDDTFKYLKGGAIQTSEWDATLYPQGIYVVKHEVAGYVNCVPTDIGKVVTDGTRTGILLDYSNTLRKWWIRRGTGTSWTGNIYVSGGDGSGILNSINTGENIYSNIYTLGLLEPTTTSLIFVEQVNPELANNQLVNYWPTGHIDIVVKVKEHGVLINSGILRTFCREYTDLYSHFTSDVSSGGRNPVPLSTSNDDNNQTLLATVQTWNDIIITFGTIYRDIGDGGGLQEYGVEVDCGSRTTVREVYERLKFVTMRDSGIVLNGAPGHFYRAVNGAYAESTFAPFGTFAGGKFFGARGVFLKDIPANDINNVQLTDANDVDRTYPFTAAGTLLVNSVLQNDPNARYMMFFTTTPAGNYGSKDAVIVNDSVGVPIAGLVNGQSSINWTFDYTFNNQGGRTVNTNAAVTIFAMGLASGYYTVVNATITRDVGQNISIIVGEEKNYSN